MPPGPTIARMRSAPDAAIMLTFEQSLLDAIAAIARIAGQEQHLVGGKLPLLGGMAEQQRRQLLRKYRKQCGG